MAGRGVHSFNLGVYRPVGHLFVLDPVRDQAPAQNAK
jgi:hypothetical protein